MHAAWAEVTPIWVASSNAAISITPEPDFCWHQSGRWWTAVSSNVAWIRVLFRLVTSPSTRLLVIMDCCIDYGVNRSIFEFYVLRRKEYRLDIRWVKHNPDSSSHSVRWQVGGELGSHCSRVAMSSGDFSPDYSNLGSLLVAGARSLAAKQNNPPITISFSEKHNYNGLGRTDLPCQGG